MMVLYWSESYGCLIEVTSSGLRETRMISLVEGSTSLPADAVRLVPETRTTGPRRTFRYEPCEDA